MKKSAAALEKAAGKKRLISKRSGSRRRSREHTERKQREREREREGERGRKEGREREKETTGRPTFSGSLEMYVGICSFQLNVKLSLSVCRSKKFNPLTKHRISSCD